jgi:hypothetical protein
MQQQYLIQPEEVRRYSTMGANANPAQLCNLIPIVENKLFREDFGNLFYADLKADAIDYSAAQVFALGTPYTAGAFVVYEGVVYEVLLNTTGAQIPTLSSPYFVTALRFATAAYQTLWVAYLAIILANACAIEAVTPSAMKQDDKGITRTETDTLRPATPQEIDMLKRNNYDLVRAHILNMEAYITSNPTLYPNYKAVLEQQQNSCLGEGYKKSKYRRNTQGWVLPPPPIY